MYFGYVSRYAHPAMAGCIVMLTIALCALNNMNILFLATPIPACIVWIWVANHLGSRRLIRLATGSARGWRATSVRDKIDSKDVRRITRTIVRARRRHQSIAVFVNSNGGNFAAARTIIEALKAHDDQVVFIILGRCMSAATIITCAFPQSDRFAIPWSSIMIHGARQTQVTQKEANSKHLQEARTWISQQIESSEHKEPVTTVNGLAATGIADGSALSESFLMALFATGGDLYFSAKNAYAVGLIGGIINP